MNLGCSKIKRKTLLGYFGRPCQLLRVSHARPKLTKSAKVILEKFHLFCPPRHACPKPGVVAAPALRAALRTVPRAALRPRGRDGWVPVPDPGVGGDMGLLRLGLAVLGRLVRSLTSR